MFALAVLANLAMIASRLFRSHKAHDCKQSKKAIINEKKYLQVVKDVDK